MKVTVDSTLMVMEASAIPKKKKKQKKSKSRSMKILSLRKREKREFPQQMCERECSREIITGNRRVDECHVTARVLSTKVSNTEKVVSVDRDAVCRDFCVLTVDRLAEAQPGSGAGLLQEVATYH
jgi:hypothetical protein